MSKFEFGDLVQVTGKITRTKPTTYKRVWFREEHSPRLALFLKDITLAEGTNESDETGIVFNPDRYLKGAWICEPGRSPRKVLYDDLSEVSAEQQLKWLRR